MYSPSSLQFTESNIKDDLSFLDILLVLLYSRMCFPSVATGVFPLYHLICSELLMALTSLMATHNRLTLSPSSATVWLLIKLIMGGPTMHYVLL